MKRIFLLCCVSVFLLYGQGSIITHVPSVVGGAEGIAVNIRYPSTARYGLCGAPVVVCCFGGTIDETMGPFVNYSFNNYGLIQIAFNYPGAGTGDSLSGGVYDLRGDTSVMAVRDVMKFALGLTPDTGGHFLADYMPGLEVDYNNVGFLGSSNGGNISIVTAGKYVSELSNVKWIVNWESPVGDGMPNIDAGSVSGGLNPAYDTISGTWDYSLLKYSAAINLGMYEGVPVIGGLYYDANNNNLFNMGVDYKYNALLYDHHTGQPKAYYSLHLIKKAFELGIFMSPPAHIPTVLEDSLFWLSRNGEYWLDELYASNPSLAFLVISSNTDHAQGAPNYPHILVQNNGFMNAGFEFVRVNPDEAYVDFVTGASPPVVDNNANTIYTFPSIQWAVEPEMVVNDKSLQYAAVLELADRTFNMDYSDNLGSTLVYVCNLMVPPMSSEQIMVYPNPAVHEVVLKNVPDNLEWVELINARGETVQVLRDLSNPTINVAGLARGLYLVKLKTANGISTLKLILQ